MGGVALACVAGRAEAADARLRVSIPPRTYSDALIDLGVQTNVSILGTSACGAAGRTELRGRFTLDEALTRLLAGAPCRYSIVDARTVRIIPYIRTAPAPQAVSEPPRPPALVAEVVITATKRPAAVDRLPAGVSAISRDQISATGAVDVGRTVGQLAGVLTTNLGPGRDKLLIRGLSDGAFTGRTRSTVSTYLDDAPINYNAPDPDLRLVDVERIEVIRGPQGALYGSGALSGIYRIVTRKPNLERAEFGATALVATTNGGDESHEVDGYVSLPLVADRVAVRLVAYDDVQGGYLDNADLRITNVDKTKRNGGRLALRVQLDRSWRFDALAATQNLRSDDTQYVILGMAGRRPQPRMNAGRDVIAAPGDRFNQVREIHNNDFSYVGGTVSGDFNWGSVTSSLSYVHHVFSSQYDASAVIGRELPVVQENDLGVYTEAARVNLIVQDLVVRSPGTGPLDWLVGFYGARTRETSPSELGILSAGPVVATAYTERRKDRQTELAVYGEGSYQLGDGWTVSLGGRLFQTRVRTTADIFVVPPFVPRAFSRSRTFNGFSPKVSVQKEFATGDLVYALVTEGYRPGGFNSSGFFEPRPNRALFAADRLRNFELGAKIKRFDGRLSLRAAAYYDDWTDIQTDQYRQSGLGYTANVGDARIIGLEAELSYDWSFGLSVQLNGLLTDSNVRNPNPDFAMLGSTVVTDLPGVPKRSGGVLVVYERPLTSALSLRLVGEASYVGPAGLSFDAALPPRISNYLRSRLAVEVANDTWRLTAFVSNPLNSDSDTFAYGNPFSFTEEGVRQATPQRPRTVGLRLGATF